MRKTAVSYYRTSSATNVGADKDSLKRQQAAVQSYAKANKIEIVREFYDEAVSGADAIEEREGFSDLLTYVATNGARTILVENASRFSRDLCVQRTGHEMLKLLGYELIPVDAPTAFTDDTPTNVMIRQILGAVSQFEKCQIVNKLKVARLRKKAATGKCEGRKSYQEFNPALVREAKRLYRKNPVSGKRRSLQKIAKELAEGGFVNGKGNVFDAKQVSRLVVG